MTTQDLVGHWTIDPAHSRIGFSSRHAMVARVRGAFNEVTGEVTVDPADPARSSATIRVQMDSVDTRNAQRDEHLRSADFFNVAEHPEMVFISHQIDEVEDNSFIVNGELTIRGITRLLSVPLELIGMDTDPNGQVRAGLEGSRRIDRRDWDVTWNTPLDSGGVLVSDKISLEFEISLVKQA